MRRTLFILLWSSLALVAAAAGLFGYFVYTPAPERPVLSGTLTTGTIESGGRERRYLLYVPRGLAKGAPLVLALHGSGEDGARMRAETGYGFDRLADRQGFAVAYPDGYDGYWNGCNIVGDYAANTIPIDDVAFLRALADNLIATIGTDPHRVFATGVSRGGHMALRLALEAPQRFRAVAAVSASVPAPGNFKCKTPRHGTTSVMLMNGTEDPLNPFNGGEARLLGLFMDRGPVLSSRASAAFFVRLNAVTSAPRKQHVAGAERTSWHGDAGADVELVAVQGGGHGMPQPWHRAPRLLGPWTREPNGPQAIWAFFAGQRPR